MILLYYTKIILNVTNLLLVEGFPKFEIVIDSGFGVSKLLDELNQKGYTYVVEVKSERKINMSQNPKRIIYLDLSAFSTKTLSIVSDMMKKILLLRIDFQKIHKL
jgi:hypothetical protein